jgi:hypothetical protein
MAERTCQTVALNVNAIAYFYGMTMSVTLARNFCGKIVKVKGMKTVPAEQKQQECPFY